MEAIKIGERTMVIMMGLPGSGKSSFANHYYSSLSVVSGDLLPTSQQVEHACENIMFSGNSFIVDATNLTLERRKPLLDLCRKYNYESVGIWLKADSKTCIERIANRVANGGAKISRVAVYTLNKKTIPPTFEEGFIRLYFVP